MYNIHLSEHVTNLEIRQRTQQPPLSDVVRARRLRFFGYVCRADSSQDQYYSTNHHYLACQRTGRGDLAVQDWRTVEKDVSSLDIGLAFAYWRAQNDHRGSHLWKRLRRWRALDDGDDDDDNDDLNAAPVNKKSLVH